ncbi:MAG: recombinase RecD [Deltaproteobacteria bacterium RBG_13_49_15]|nr:MAG: recombinase RecD [Deltaproteobacteria bacterium RBG_13_49_15]
METDLSGQIERITYTNEEDGFTIAKIKVTGAGRLVTVVGNLLAPTPGETIRMQGYWENHPKYGEQFRISTYKTEIPATVYGIRKYLGSGMIKGIGPVMAERIVELFGIRTLKIIEHEPETLNEVSGIGKKRIAMIRKGWEDQREIRDVMLFLQTHGISPGFAAKIFKTYGDRSIEIVKSNPYRLAFDIYGVGFLTADRIAEKLGIPKDSEMRIGAGIVHTLQQLAEEGHVFCPYDELQEKCCNILSVDPGHVERGLESMVRENRLVIEDQTDGQEDHEKRARGVFLFRFHRYETGIAERMKTLMSSPKTVWIEDSGRVVEKVRKTLSISLTKNQTHAVESALHHKVMIITGGPGTGKTTIINAILKLYLKQKAVVHLAAPTGRAAKRMSETSGHHAKTIHRLLEYSIKHGGFQRSELKPLKCHLIIVDEASMIDTFLMYHLLKAIPDTAILILVGDVDQLPSVGPGNVLKDMIGSNGVPVVILREIFRQAQNSQIIMNAHRINTGNFPNLRTPDLSAPDADFYFIEQEDPQKVLETIIRLVKERIPNRFGFHPVDDIQVLSPMHKGVVGADNLNRELQQALNPGEEGVRRGTAAFRMQDKVMQIRNNYDKEVFNGDIGKISRILSDDQEVIVSFDGREVTYDYSDLDELVLAYAISVHKSQGSEYPAVVVPMLTQHYILLKRNLIYTAVTRAQKLMIMVGTRKALAIGINNDKTQKRYTRLQVRLTAPKTLMVVS